MPTTGTLRVGQVDPQVYQVAVSQISALPSFDFTTVTSAEIRVLKPSGATQTWTGALSSQTTTGLTFTRTLVAGDLDEAGTYTGYLLMTVPTGTVRSETERFFVAEEFADIEAEDAPAWFIAGAIISGGGGSTPTGTGVPKIVGGVQDAAASLIVNADVDAAAAIAVSKLAAGTNTYVLTTTAGVPVWAAPSAFTPPTGTGVALVSGGVLVGAAGTVNLASGTYVTGVLAVANGGTGLSSLASGMATFLGGGTSAGLANAMTDETGSGALVFGTTPSFTTSFKLVSGSFAYTFLPSGLVGNVNVTLPTLSSSDTFVFEAAAQTLTNKIISAATNPASTGNYRLANADKICIRNGGNSADVCIAQYSAGDALHIGLNSSFTEQAFTIIQASGYAQYFGIGSSYYWIIESTKLSAGAPIVGNSAPYSVHGQAACAHTDANYTVPAGEYMYETLKFGTACTAGRTMTLPAPASDAAAYHKEIINTTGQTLTFSTGAGATKTLANGLGQWMRFTSSEGVKYASGTYTP